MSVLTAVSSLLGATVFVLAGLVVSVTVRRLCFPAWRASLAVTTVILVWLCWAMALGQILGAVGLLRRIALLVAAMATAAGAIALSRAVDTRNRRSAPGMPEPAGPAGGKAMATAGSATESGWQASVLTVGTVVLVLFVAAIWIARTVIALRRGINDPDSLAYHIPFAVTFVQSGYADQNRLLLPLLPVHFFPANDELLSAMALAVTHSVAFAIVKNTIFGGFAVVAAHALGKAFGAARLTVAACAIVLGFPAVAFSQSGEATNDTLLLLVLVGGLAVLAHARDRPAPFVLAMACAGAALGVKFSGLVPGATLGLLALILLLARVPSRRWRWAGGGLLAAGATGASWYVRNAIRYGNPVPPVRVGLGPLHLRTIHSVAADLSFSVAHYAVHGRLLGTFARGLVRGLGPLVLVTAALCLWGVTAGLRSPDGWRRGLSVAAMVSLIGYLVTPAGAYGTVAQVANTFVVNLHYAAPALLFGMLAGGIAVARSRLAWAFPAVGVAAVATSITPGRGIAFWSPEIGGPGFALLLVATLAGGSACFAWSRPPLRRMAALGTAAAVMIAVAAVAIIPGRYQSRRATDPVVHWAATVRGARIASWVGDIPDLFNIGSLYGPQDQNRVVNLNRVVDGVVMPIDSCQGLKRAVRDGHFGYTAATIDTAGFRWLRADPAFRAVADETAGGSAQDFAYLRRYRAVVFQVAGQPDVECPGQAAPP